MTEELTITVVECKKGHKYFLDPKMGKPIFCEMHLLDRQQKDENSGIVSTDWSICRNNIKISAKTFVPKGSEIAKVKELFDRVLNELPTNDGKDSGKMFLWLNNFDKELKKLSGGLE